MLTFLYRNFTDCILQNFRPPCWVHLIGAGRVLTDFKAAVLYPAYQKTFSPLHCKEALLFYFNCNLAYLKEVSMRRKQRGIWGKPPSLRATLVEWKNFRQEMSSRWKQERAFKFSSKLWVCLDILCFLTPERVSVVYAALLLHGKSGMGLHTASKAESGCATDRAPGFTCSWSNDWTSLVHIHMARFVLIQRCWDYNEKKKSNNGKV